MGDIRPHRDFTNKTCPGKLFNVDELRDIVAEEMSVLRR